MRAGSAFLLRLIATVSGASASMAVLWAVSRWRSFCIGDVNGIVYQFVITPAGGGLAAALLVSLFPAKLATRRLRLMMAVFVVAAVSAAVHTIAIHRHWVGGWYRLPDGMALDRAGDAAVARRAFDRNEEIAGAALAELERRDSRDGLALVLQLGAHEIGQNYFESTVVQDAAEALAVRRDPRALPVLRAMLGSNDQIRATRQDAGRESEWIVFPVRQRAVELLGKYFKEQHVDAETERRVR